MGRPKGSKNLKHRFTAEMIADGFKHDPFEILMMYANNDWKKLGYDSEVYHSEKPDGTIKMGYVITPELRMYAAREACRYLYTPRQAAQLDINVNGNITVEQKEKLAEEWKAKILELAPAINEDDL
jgi:hypothetical protein